MAATTPLLLRLVASSVCTAHRAGLIIRDILSKGDLGIIDKGGLNDLQTQADRSAQTCIMTSLNAVFPDVKLIGEEEEEADASCPADWVEKGLSEEVMKLADQMPADLKDVKPEDVVVWVDPLDGTSEYTQGLLDHVTVLIGVGVKGKAVGGVMYQPYYNYKNPGAKIGRAIWGIIGLGAFGYDKKKAADGERIICTTRSHGTKEVMDAVQACEPSEVLRVGGCGHKVLILLEGQSHAYVFASPGCKKWDTCAPEAILHAAGGKLTDIHGSTITYEATVQVRNSGGVLATPGMEEHQWYKERIPQTVRDALPV